MDPAGIVTAFIMLLLPVRYFKKLWTILQGRSNVMKDDAEINIGSAMWGVFIIKSIGEFPVIFNITQIGYMFLFTVFNIMLLKKRCNRFVILFELTAFFVLARLAVTFHDPVEFAKTVCAASSIFASMTRVIFCGPSLENVAALFANGVICSIFGLLLSDIFILIPNLIGGILGLVLAIRYRRK